MMLLFGAITGLFRNEENSTKYSSVWLLGLAVAKWNRECNDRHSFIECAEFTFWGMVLSVTDSGVGTITLVIPLIRLADEMMNRIMRNTMNIIMKTYRRRHRDCTGSIQVNQRKSLVFEKLISSHF